MSAVTLRRARWPLAALAAAVVALFLLGFPLRTYMEQRGALSSARQTVEQLSSQNASLRSQAALLQKPSEIEQLARERYGLVRPGQEEYAILPAPVTAHAAKAAHPAAGAVAKPPSSGSPATATTGSASSGGLWSRFVGQLEFWR